MQTFSSKELYMMNGGNKLYIYKDGFGNIYNATQAEEAEWTKEIITNALLRIDEEENTSVLKSAIGSLQFHKYKGLEALLITKLNEAGPKRQIVFATALWCIYRYRKSFEIIYQNLRQHRDECLNDVFLSLDEFKDDKAAKAFLIACLEDDDDILFEKASATISLWAYTGMQSLRENSLPDLLKIENKNEPIFKKAVEQLKQIFQSRKPAHK